MVTKRHRARSECGDTRNLGTSWQLPCAGIDGLVASHPQESTPWRPASGSLRALAGAQQPPIAAGDKRLYLVVHRAREWRPTRRGQVGQRSVTCSYA